MVQANENAWCLVIYSATLIGINTVPTQPRSSAALCLQLQSSTFHLHSCRGYKEILSPEIAKAACSPPHSYPCASEPWDPPRTGTSSWTWGTAPSPPPSRECHRSPRCIHCRRHTRGPAVSLPTSPCHRGQHSSKLRGQDLGVNQLVQTVQVVTV